MSSSELGYDREMRRKPIDRAVEKGRGAMRRRCPGEGQGGALL